MVHQTPVVRGRGALQPALAPYEAPSGALLNFEVRNSVGTLIATADSAEQAKAFVLRNKLRFPSLRVERVETTIRREVIYKPRGVTP